MAVRADVTHSMS